MPIFSDATNSVRSRQELEELLIQYEEVLGSTVYSEAINEDVRNRANQIRERLSRGDFRLGDAVVLFVEGEIGLPDTVAVQSGPDGPTISLPVFGDVSLDGVLRSEVQDHIAAALGAFIRNPVVRAQGLMRISVQGSVGAPGFYVVPADMLLSETLMVAGGPAANYDLESLRIQRGSDVLMDGEALQEDLRQGRTLDQLNLQAGDQVFLPQAGVGFFSNFGVMLGVVSSLTVAIVQLSR